MQLALVRKAAQKAPLLLRVDGRVVSVPLRSYHEERTSSDLASVKIPLSWNGAKVIATSTSSPNTTAERAKKKALDRVSTLCCALSYHLTIAHVK